MAISEACPDAPPEGSMMAPRMINWGQGGDGEGWLTMDHDAGVGEAMPFPLFSCAVDRVHKSSALEACYGDITNQRREGENPWRLLDPHNKCVSVTKRTGRYVYAEELLGSESGKGLTCIYNNSVGKRPLSRLSSTSRCTHCIVYGQTGRDATPG